MSFWLPARNACLDCPCPGTYFRFPEGRTPQAYTDTCICSHAYTVHQVDLAPDPENPNHTRLRGANVPLHCGGFLAPQIPAWDFPNICVAYNARLFHHSLLEIAQQPTQRPLVLEVPFPRLPASYLPPPASIYQSAIPPRVEFHPGNPIAPSFERPEPDRGTIPSMRDRSRLDNLPQHNSLRPGPGIRALAMPVASGSSTTPNPFAVTTTVRPANPSASSKDKERRKALKSEGMVVEDSVKI
ncbi:hypothetical protein B0H14DRAFT_3631974 [Mycena olivaceomarginata]|nr:hypothetical protein B0H14DRAFT_3631974 [Mycena olivaceomarginata]